MAPRPSDTPRQRQRPTPQSGGRRTPTPTACGSPRASTNGGRCKKGQIAVYSVLREWIKGQLTAIETGMLSFEAAFLPCIMLPTGETVLERIDRDNVLPLPGPTPAY